MTPKKGKLIVIDGTDGSGKTTQLSLLVERLKKQKKKIKIVDFPQYNTKSAGLVEEYLSGKYGQANEVDPRVASLFYALDRYDASFKIREWLDQGFIIISNRYVASNMGHQGAKFKDAKKRSAFFKWLYDIEYNLLKVPVPDQTIILHVDAKTAQDLSLKRAREDWKGKTKDIHEGNLKHLQQAEKTYLQIAESTPHISKIECVKNNKLLSKEEIHELVWKKIKALIK